MIKLITMISLPVLLFCSCVEKQQHTSAMPVIKPVNNRQALSEAAYNNSRGYGSNGEATVEFDCPDDTCFAPIELRNWDKTPAVNGRLPTYGETTDGTAILHYGEKITSSIKPYPLSLPKLAYCMNRGRKELVVVIQVTQINSDTAVGYRYLSGGAGGGRFHDFYFLNEKEVEKVINE